MCHNLTLTENKNLNLKRFSIFIFKFYTEDKQNAKFLKKHQKNQKKIEKRYGKKG